MTKLVVVEELIDNLPFKESMSWEKFQTFCADILFKQKNISQSREYLRQGSEQQGIDIYAISDGQPKITVAQCKLEEHLFPGDIFTLIDEFLKGHFVATTKEFILCTSADLSRQRNQEDTLQKARAKLDPFEITLKIWDQPGLSQVIRTNVDSDIIHIVLRYFTEPIAKAFFGKFWSDFISKFRIVKKRVYQLPADYIKRTISKYNETIYPIKQQTLTGLFTERLLDKPFRIALLSTAGFGKTEELEYFSAWFSAKDKISYPVRFFLRDYQGQDIESLVAGIYPEWQSIEERNLLLIFDGLDEIGSNHEQTFKNYINGFLESHANVSAVVSSRYNFYDVGQSPLRGFNIYILNQLTFDSIQEYLISRLGERIKAFEDLVEKRNFRDFFHIPYYISRLVRLYLSGDEHFPRNKTDLFQKVLFEQLEKTSGIQNISDWKSLLLPLAERIAFCMVLSGKTSITEKELTQVVPEQEARLSLKRFSIINQNVASPARWAFEHKNLQEYLCASSLSKWSFQNIIPTISYPLGNSRLLPQLLNTISLLFELSHTSENTTFFHELFTWLYTNEPELLIRFEKEQIQKSTRNEIFFRIFESYKAKDISLRISSNFSLDELSRFVDGDEEVIDFLLSQLSLEISEAIMFDTLTLLAHTPRAYRFRPKINFALINVLRDVRISNEVKSYILRCFYYLELINRDLFEEILATGIDLTHFEIRKACLALLENTEFAEDYLDFILKSIGYIELGHQQTNQTGSFLVLTRLLVGFNNPTSIKKVIQLFIHDKAIVSRHSYKEFEIDTKDFNSIIEKAAGLFPQNKSLLRVVYRLFRQLEYEAYEKGIFESFKNYFELTIELPCIFKKLYKHGEAERDYMHFADKSACDFLAHEFSIGNRTTEQIIRCRNNLSFIDYPLFLYFNAELEKINKKEFEIENLNVDHNQILLIREQKNQAMLLDKSLFQKEAKTIFSILNKKKIVASDVFYIQEKGIKPYAGSIVMEAIRKVCFTMEDHKTSENEFFDWLENPSKWQGFVLEKGKELLEKAPIKIDPKLVQMLKDWCVNKIDTIDFTNSISDNSDGSYNYYYQHEFIKSLLLLLKLDLTDKQYLKLLSTDTSYYHNIENNEKTITGLILRKVQNKALLKDTVLKLLKSNVSYHVRCSLYAVCQVLGYRECLSELFNFIIHEPFLSGENRKMFTQFYLDLGGNIMDFNGHMLIPEPEGNATKYAEWQWFLIDQNSKNQTSRVIDILLQILSSDRVHNDKLRAAERLIKLGHIEGLSYWALFVNENKRLPTNFHWETLVSSLFSIPFFKDVLNILFGVLTSYYKGEFRQSPNEFYLIDETVYKILIPYSINNNLSYLESKIRLESLIEQNRSKDFVHQLRYALERLTQQFYKAGDHYTNIEEAFGVYQTHFSETRRFI